QADVRGAARPIDGGLAGAVREASTAEHLQSPTRPVRAGAIQLERLLRLDDQSRATALPGAGACRRADPELREVPAAAKTCVVQPGRGDAPAAGKPQVTWDRADHPRRAPCPPGIMSDATWLMK